MGTSKFHKFTTSYVMVYNRGYQDRGDVESAVTTKVKGVAYSNFSDDQLHVPDAYKPMYRRIWDVADQVIPASENNAFFVATNVIITPNQTIGLCPEVRVSTISEHSVTIDTHALPEVLYRLAPVSLWDDPAVPGAICDDDPYSCPIGEPFLLGNGVRTGRCSNETEGNPRTCEIHAWCPVEVNNMPLLVAFFILGDGLALLEGVQNYTVLLKNFIAFPKFGEEYRRRNILDSYTKEQLNSCHFDPKNDSYCPIFTLGTIIQEAGISNFTDIAISGGVVAIEISWDCNLDRDFKSHCLPKYEFRRLDDPNAKVAPGWNFRYAQYYRDDVRTLFKVFGIKFVVNVYGEARKFSIIPTLLNIGSGLALLGLAEVVCDLVVLYIFSKGPVYREAKYQVVHGEDAYKVSEGEEEEEVGRRDNRSYRTFRDS
ncbi:unnamed protein product [Darwinula stevensoni]|uniref:Purinergic receptor n=1 Tax=Darwinula stevensoni TaxID=69355 RepID=A0A7R8XA10_9CRUS|nr:unnamed protein product [Darwinula stevensoni]CAG0883151.1 unnamed protein product [Darwinula stevensoni]